MNNYKVSYSGEALSDLREIYSYIAYELLVPKTAAAQIKRIREKNPFIRFYASLS